MSILHNKEHLYKNLSSPPWSICQSSLNFLCFPPLFLQNNGIVLKSVRQCQKIFLLALLGCFCMSEWSLWQLFSYTIEIFSEYLEKNNEFFCSYFFIHMKFAGVYYKLCLEEVTQPRFYSAFQSPCWILRSFLFSSRFPKSTVRTEHHRIKFPI